LRVEKKKKVMIRKRWRHPDCGVEIESIYDGERVAFLHGGKEFSACGGDYIEVRIPCPGGDGYLVFEKEELEKE